MNTPEHPATGESYRDHLATVDAKGRRKWVFAQKPHGKWYRRRSLVSLLFFALFAGIPFIYVNGQPFVQFNIPEARFIIFSKIFWPQDFFIFGLGMVTFVVSVILFTAAFGRLFCGWICPQTIFMEMLFRKVEYWIIGDGPKQKSIRQGQKTAAIRLKITLKHVIFFALSFVIANLFLSYIISVRSLLAMITGPFSQHLAGLASLLLFTTVFYAVYAFFREQACTVICPYGRLQSVLLDRNSMIVAYDYKRGEPRTKFSKHKAEGIGDCIDCLQCVKVCPTGIDIRNGTQMECVACTACIDACNFMMEKTGRAPDLIRYASENGIAEHQPLKYTMRMKLYTGLLTVLVALLALLLFSRKEVDATVMRTPGMLFQERGTDSVSNLYTIKVANKTIRPVPLTLRLEDRDGEVQVIGDKAITIRKEEEGSGNFFIILPRKDVRQRKTRLMIGLYDGQTKIDEIATNFLGPVPGDGDL